MNLVVHCISNPMLPPALFHQEDSWDMGISVFDPIQSVFPRLLSPAYCRCKQVKHQNECLEDKGASCDFSLPRRCPTDSLRASANSELYYWLTVLARVQMIHYNICFHQIFSSRSSIKGSISIPSHPAEPSGLIRNLTRVALGTPHLTAI